MSKPIARVAVIVGSLRAESLSRKIAKALIARAPKSLECEVVEIGELALYNEDLDHGSPPAAWTAFRGNLEKADAVLFVTPEYNRSIPGCLKNALDVGSRPEGKSVFDGMPAGVVSVTPYKLGAFGANHALRQTFVFLNMPVMQQPEAYIGKAGDVVEGDGKIKDPEAEKLIASFMTAFDAWVAVNRRDGGSEGTKRDFEAFMRNRHAVALDYVNGDAKSLEAIVTKNDPATFFSPGGDTVRGAAAVTARYAHDAKLFQRGGTTKLEVFQSGASGDLAFWTGLQHAESRMAGKNEQVPMTLRITEIFRVEGGEYKLVHRHAEMAEKPKPRG
jgi:NAD(P)H-dependent FMN reductase/ketosteroid isomerase-like protein